MDALLSAQCVFNNPFCSDMEIVKILQCMKKTWKIDGIKDFSICVSLCMASSYIYFLDLPPISCYSSFPAVLSNTSVCL